MLTAFLGLFKSAEHRWIRSWARSSLMPFCSTWTRFALPVPRFEMVCNPSYIYYSFSFAKFPESFRNCRSRSLSSWEGTFPEALPAAVQQSTVHHYCMGRNERPLRAPWSQRAGLHCRLGLLRLPSVGGVFSAKADWAVSGQWPTGAANCHVKVARWLAWLYLQ